METLKQKAIKIISTLPDDIDIDIDIDGIMYKLYVIDKIKKGEDAVLKGKIITHEELKKEVLTW